MAEFEMAARHWFQSLPLAAQLTAIFGLLFLLAFIVTEMNKTAAKLWQELEDDEDAQ